MADLNKFQRSKERITEILNYLTMTDNDHQANPYFNKLKQSAQLIDAKIEQLSKQEPAKNTA
jgi:hypothetical protein